MDTVSSNLPNLTNLGSRLTVLTLSVVYRGGGIPVAWVRLSGTAEADWQPQWETLFTLTRGLCR